MPNDFYIFTSNHILTSMISYIPEMKFYDNYRKSYSSMV